LQTALGNSIKRSGYQGDSGSNSCGFKLSQSSSPIGFAGLLFFFLKTADEVRAKRHNMKSAPLKNPLSNRIDDLIFTSKNLERVKDE